MPVLIICMFMIYKVLADNSVSYRNLKVKVKGKAVPLQAWSGREGCRKLRFTDYVTVTQDGGKVVSLMQWPHLPSGNAPGTHFC